MASGNMARVGIMGGYDVVVAGAAELLRPHHDLVRVVDPAWEGGPGGADGPVDVALLDCFALPVGRAAALCSSGPSPGARVALYTWANAPELIEEARALGAHGYLSKGLSGRDLARALAAVARGDQVVEVSTVAVAAAQADHRPPEARRWPGVDAGLTERESEVLALITQGRRAAEIATGLHLSVNSVKTHTRNLFRKLGVASRTEAALWGVDHGFRPDRTPGEGTASP